ncbi:hypothetical protein DIS09_31830, partial [Burkholderia pseudomallei]
QGTGPARMGRAVTRTLGSLEERHAAGETVPRETTLELGDEFA